jgi:hypothetical protein
MGEAGVIDTVVTWRWTPPEGYRSTFPPETVNVLRRMVQRHYPKPHRFVCVTDDAAGIDPEVEIVRAWNDFADVPSPTGAVRNPSCYRRLRMFHPEIGRVFGDRFVSLDLDMVITGDLQPVWDRSEDIVLYGDTNPRTFYNGSMILMSAGVRPEVWIDFDPVHSPQRSKLAGHHGSDQGWISHRLGAGEAKWSHKDGVYSYRNDLAPHGASRLPADARVVIFHGAVDPWAPQGQRLSWVQEFWR